MKFVVQTKLDIHICTALYEEVIWSSHDIAG